TITNETLQASIDDIDMAIGDAREALAREPGDALSQESLLDALSSKVALLQDTVALLGDVEPATEAQTPWRSPRPSRLSVPRSSSPAPCRRKAASARRARRFNAAAKRCASGV